MSLTISLTGKVEVDAGEKKEFLSGTNNVLGCNRLDLERTSIENKNILFIRLIALGAYLILGP